MSKAAVRWSAQYAGRLTLAYLLAVAAAFIIVVPMGGISVSGPYAFFTERNVITAALSVIVGTVAARPPAC